MTGVLPELEYSAVAKFKVLSEPLQMPPHKCIGCGRYSSGDPAKPLQFIDMGFDIEFTGEAFICVDGCFREIMNQLGVLTREQTTKIEEKLQQLIWDTEKTKEWNRELNNAVGSLNRALRDANDGYVSSPVDTVVARKENEPISIVGTSKKSVTRKDGPTKPAHELGSTKLPDPQSNKLFGDI